jgi:hypothetical protein
VIQAPRSRWSQAVEAGLPELAIGIEPKVALSWSTGTGGALLAAGLLDRLVLWIHPFLIGRGGPQDLLYRDNELTTFELVDVIQLESQIVVLSHELAPE